MYLWGLVTEFQPTQTNLGKSKISVLLAFCAYFSPTPKVCAVLCGSPHDACASRRLWGSRGTPCGLDEVSCRVARDRGPPARSQGLSSKMQENEFFRQPKGSLEWTLPQLNFQVRTQPSWHLLCGPVRPWAEEVARLGPDSWPTEMWAAECAVFKAAKRVMIADGAAED